MCFDKVIFSLLIAVLAAGCVNPQTMVSREEYDDVVAEVRAFFETRLALAQESGIELSRICLDPGIGFGKTVEHNLALLRNLEAIRVQNLPMLIALSRKRFMGDLLGDSSLVRTQAWPTVVMTLLAAECGADMHRVHDVAEICGALTLRRSLL